MAKSNTDLDFSMFDEEEDQPSQTPKKETQIPDNKGLDVSMFDKQKTSSEPAPIEEIPVESEEDENRMGKLRALASGISESATLGADRILGGLVGVVGEAALRLSPDYLEAEAAMRKQGLVEKDKKGFKDAYYEGKKGVSKQAEKAMEDQMGTFLAGSLVGGIPATKAVSGILGGAKALANANKAKELAEVAKMSGNFSRADKLKTLANKLSLGQNIKEAAATGAAYGALSGDAKLAEGDIAGTLKDAATTAAIGGGLAGGLGKLGQTISGAVDKNAYLKGIVDSYTRGKAGKSVSPQLLTEEAKKQASEVMGDTKVIGKKLSKAYDIMENAAKEGNLTQNSRQALEEARKEIIASAEGNPKALEKFSPVLEEIDNYLGVSKAEQKALSSFEDKAIKEALRNPEKEAQLALEKARLKSSVVSGESPTATKTGLTTAEDVLPSPIGSPEVSARKDTFIDPKTEIPYTKYSAANINKKEFGDIKGSMIGDKKALSIEDLASGKVDTKVLSPEQLNSLNPEQMTFRQLMTAKGFIDDLESAGNVPSAIQGTVRKLKSSLSEKINTLRETVRKTPEVSQKLTQEGINISPSELNKKYKNFSQVKDILDWSPDATETEKLRKMMNIMKTGQMEGTITSLDELVETMNKVDPKFIKNNYAKIQDIGQKLNFADILAGQQEGGAIKNVLMGSSARGLAEVANYAGKLVGSLPSTKPLTSAISRSFITQDVNQLNQISQKVLASPQGQMFKPVLEKAMAAPPTKRQAILFGLYSNPVFRKISGLDTEEQSE